MRRFRITDLSGDLSAPHVLARLVPGMKLYKGSVSWHAPGHISHDGERPHVETDHEVFCILQGEGWIEIEGVREEARTGDVFVIDPGEDHHLISSDHSPFVNLWLHAE